MDSRAGLDILQKRNIFFTLAGIQVPERPARSLVAIRTSPSLISPEDMSALFHHPFEIKFLLYVSRGLTLKFCILPTECIDVFSL